MKTQLTAPQCPTGNHSEPQNTPSSLPVDGSDPVEAPPSYRSRRPQVILKPLTDISELDTVSIQYNHIQGGRPPKLQVYITSEDPPPHIPHSTKSARRKAILDFRATTPGVVMSVEELDEWARGLEITPEAERGARRVKAALTQSFPGMFKGPEVH